MSSVLTRRLFVKRFSDGGTVPRATPEYEWPGGPADSPPPKPTWTTPYAPAGLDPETWGIPSVINTMDQNIREQQIRDEESGKLPPVNQWDEDVKNFRAFDEAYGGRLKREQNKRDASGEQNLILEDIDRAKQFDTDYGAQLKREQDKRSQSGEGNRFEEDWKSIKEKVSPISEGIRAIGDFLGPTAEEKIILDRLKEKGIAPNTENVAKEKALMEGKVDRPKYPTRFPELEKVDKKKDEVSMMLSEIAQNTTPSQTSIAKSAPASSATAKMKRPKYKNYMDTTKNLQQFAKDIGIDLSNPYDSWAYIRDMSAGLLASNSGTFLGDLGNAALLSNKNRATADAAQRELQAKLGLAKWKNEEDWAKLGFEKDMDLYESMIESMSGGDPFKLGTIVNSFTDDNGIKRDVYNITKGANSVPMHMRHYWPNGTFGLIKRSDDEEERWKYNQERTEDLWGKIDAITSKPLVFGPTIKLAMMTNTYQADYILGIQENDQSKYKELMQSLKNAAPSGAAQLDNLLAVGDPDAANIARALADLPQVRKAIKDFFTGGVGSDAVDVDYAAITNQINRVAKAKIAELATTDRKAPVDIQHVLNNATGEVIRQVNWGEKDFNKRYAWGLTSAQMAATKESLDKTQGTGMFKLAQTPEFWKGEVPTGGSMFNKPREWGWSNLDQLDLLEPPVKSSVEIDMTYIADFLTRKGMDQKKAMEDIIVSYQDSRLVWGGEDTPGGGNLKSLYKKPKAWYVEPESYTRHGVRYETKDLREKFGIYWNGFKGQWFTFVDEGKTRKVITLRKDPNIEVAEPKRIKIED